MPEPVNSVLVLIASPGDALEERATVRDALNDWNVNTGRRLGVVILPWLYERHAVPGMTDRGQALINSQAVDRADVVLAFFDSRLGTRTEVDVSGTAEEINRAINQGKPTHVYFSNEDLPRDVDPKQLKALAAFRDDLEARGLLGDYSDPGDLAAQAIRAVEHDITEAGWGEGLQPTSRRGAQLTWEHVHTKEPAGVDSKGRPKIRTTRNHLVVRNLSTTTAAEHLTFEFRPISGDHGHLFEGPEGPVTLYPSSELEWRLITTRSFTAEISARWMENGIPREQVVTTTVR